MPSDLILEENIFHFGPLTDVVDNKMPCHVLRAPTDDYSDMGKIARQQPCDDVSRNVSLWII